MNQNLQIFLNFNSAKKFFKITLVSKKKILWASKNIVSPLHKGFIMIWKNTRLKSVENFKNFLIHGLDQTLLNNPF